MARFEQKHVYPFIKGKLDLYLRYIDDIFFIWKGTEEKLKNSFNEINKKHPFIKFDQKYSKSKIEFLDVLVYKDEQQKLKTTLFKKNTNRQSYRHAKSDHPVSLKKSIPYSQILRVKRICSTNSEFERNCKVLQEQFTKRGCDSSPIKTEIKKVKLLDRKDLLTPKTTQKTQMLTPTVTYNRTLPNIKQIIQNHWSILKTNKALEKIIAFRKTKV